MLKFQLACEQEGITPVIGATYTVYNEEKDLRYDVKTYALDENGWQEILAINKEVNVINNKFITESKLLEIVSSVVLIADPKSISYRDSLRLPFSYYQLDPVEFTNNDIDKEYLINLKKFVRSNFPPISIVDAFYLEEEHSEIKKLLNSISGVVEYEFSKQYFKDKDDYLFELESLFNINDDFIFDISTKAMENELKLAKKL